MSIVKIENGQGQELLHFWHSNIMFNLVTFNACTYSITCFLLLFIWKILDVDAYESSLNDKLGFEYTIGMLFDGYQVYRDLEESPLSELATFYVYEDPKINTFKESINNEVLVSESYCVLV